MWRATVGYNLNDTCKNGGGDDDWETDPDFINDVTEEEQRWGSKTVEGSGRTAGAINIHELRSEVEKDDAEFKKKVLESGPKASYGYGGKFGVQQDRMDRSAVGHDYIAQVEKHASQIDAAKGFGGKYGVQADRQDKSAVGWDHHEKVDKHTSQKDYATGFGGKYGVQTDRVDRTAVGWDHIEKPEKHESQKDYAKGFGGKYGVDKERQDKSAVGWEYHEKTEKHPSQRDYSKGFGGKFGVQEDRKDKSALGWDVVTKVEAHPSQTDMKKGFGGQFGIEKDRQDKSAYDFKEIEKPKSAYERTNPEVVTAKTSSLRARFENMAKAGEEEAKKKLEEERAKRIAREQKERDEAKKDEEERQRKLSLNQDDEFEEPEHREPVLVTAVRTSVAVPTPIIQAATAKGASPETTSFHHPPLVSHPPPQFEDDHKPEDQQEQLLQDPGFLEPVLEEPSDDLYSQPQSYLEPAYETLEETHEELYEERTEGTGLSAIALYDYQAADSDEISFDPDEIITNIEMIDDGWWRGECRNQVGLFPANYVQLLQ